MYNRRRSPLRALLSHVFLSRWQHRELWEFDVCVPPLLQWEPPDGSVYKLVDASVLRHFAWGKRRDSCVKCSGVQGKHEVVCNAQYFRQGYRSP